MPVPVSSTRRFLLVSLLAIICICILPTWSFADQAGLEKVQKAIKEKKAHWTAAETSVSNLSPEDKQKRAGTRKPVLTQEEEQAAAEEQAALAALTAPASYDWRAAGGTNPGNYVTAVKNQGSCGSCWAFATTAALESQVLLSDHTPGVKMDLSEQLLVSCGNAGSCSGGSPSTASSYIRDMGLPVETCDPYTATNGSCSAACPDWASNTYRILGWRYVASGTPTVDVLKNALCTYGPLAVTMSVYSDFYYYKSGVYSYTSGTYVGGHAILLVGYDDANQCFIVKNSWGTGWGEAGFFRVAYSELNDVVAFGHYPIAYEGAYGPDDPVPCTFSLSPTSKTFKSPGGSGTITVASQTGCAWTAVSNVAWVTVTAGANGSGNGSVSYSVAPNLNRATRTGTLTIAGQTFTVTEQGVKITRK